MGLYRQYREALKKEFVSRGISNEISMGRATGIKSEILFDIWKVAVSSLMPEGERSRFGELAQDAQEKYFSHQSRLKFGLFQNQFRELALQRSIQDTVH